MAAHESPSEGQTYFQILKSMAMIGGSSLVNVGFSIVRNKAMALLLGPAGVGQMGLYMSIVDLTQAVAGLGVQASGVRQIAEAVGAGDMDRIARTAAALRRTSIALGVVGAVLLAALAQPVAHLTFGDHQHTLGVSMLALAIFFQLVAGGQLALVQGVRDIASLALINVLSGLCATVATIALVYAFGAEGVAPSIVASALALFLIASWFSRRVRVTRPAMSARDLVEEVSPLLKLGIVFMVSALLTFGASYVIRLIVLYDAGVAAAGLYQAAWALGGLYAGFILQAMGADFYPRLTAVASDHAACNRLVNDQTQVSLLLAGPGVLATLTLAPLAMWLFYSPEFYPAADILRWICLGMMLRVVSWPMGFIMVAKGNRALFFWAEVAATVVHVGLAKLLVARAGPIGAGAAFFALYVWHTGLVYVVSRHLTGFRWSAINFRLGIVFLTTAGLVFLGTLTLSPWQAMACGGAATLLSGFLCLRRLLRLLPPDALPTPFRLLLRRPERKSA